ncbi:hypothetical protein WAF17_15405 [Bernardetia sp. ABR2-2B]|uniref:hypothetical protein n=1 Tax=Bernardetia sp. ABR2-2B TaxID=3127472 RepID=UPI0030CD4B7A
MKKHNSILLLTFNILIFFSSVNAQTIDNFSKFTKEQMEVKYHPLPSRFVERGDTSITIFTGFYEDYAIYFVNPYQCFGTITSNPIGLIIDGKEYGFYCDSERETKKHVFNFLDIYEFEYLDRKYVSFVSPKENDFTDDNLTYFCYNFFDITDRANVIANSYTKDAKQTTVWEELEVLHQAIALTFHPAEDGDFEPVKNDSDELLEAAKNLSNSELPAYFEKTENQILKKEIQVVFPKLVQQSKELHNLVQEKKATDKELLQKLNNLHSIYHHIEKLNNQAKKSNSKE